LVYPKVEGASSLQWLSEYSAIMNLDFRLQNVGHSPAIQTAIELSTIPNKIFNEQAAVQEQKTVCDRMRGETNNLQRMDGLSRSIRHRV